jgi:hypothetical protein
VNQDTRIEHDEAELRTLEESAAVGFTDGWGEFSPVDNVAKGESQARATDGYEWLVANPTGDAAGFTTEVAAGMLAHATAWGRTQPLQRAVEVVPLWITVAHAANKIPAADWPSFRDLLLAAVDLATALESMGKSSAYRIGPCAPATSCRPGTLPPTACRSSRAPSFGAARCTAERRGS